MRWLENTHKRGQKLISDVPLLERLDGHQVNVNQHGLVTIKCRRRDGRIAAIQIKLGSSLVPHTYFEARTVHFTQNGIDIRNQEGVTLHTRGKTKQATIPFGELPACGQGSELLKVWVAITGLEAPNLASSSTSESGTMIKGSPIPNKMPKLRDPRNRRKKTHCGLYTNT